MKCVKFVLFAFNLIFFLAGLGLIIAGAIVQTKFSTYFDFFGGSFSAAAILLIIVGAVIFVIGFFGCCGAYKENYCMVMTFAVLLGVVFVLEIAAGIAAYVMRDKVHGIVEEHMMDSMQNYNATGHEGVTDAWNTMQIDFQCCGVQNYTNWRGATTGLGADSVPYSCCNRTQIQETCGMGQLDNPTQIHTNGCIDGFTAWVKENIYVVGGVGIGLAFIQIFGVIITCCFGQAIRKEYETV